MVKLDDEVKNNSLNSVRPVGGVRPTSKGGLVTGVALSLLMTSHSAWAQTPAESTATERLPTVVIEGEGNKTREQVGYKAEKTRVGKTAQDPKDIPQAVTVVTQQLMHEKNATTLREALRNVAGVTFNAGEGGRIGDNITLRGYSAVSDLYLDNMRDVAQYNRDTFNLEQVDVLKGSSSMLFGRGSTGGVINQVSKTAKPVAMHEVNVTGGSNDYRRVTADLNTPITDNVAFRLNFMNLDAKSFRTGVDQKSTGVAPTLSIGAGTDDEWNLSYYYLNTDNTPDFGVPYFQNAPLNVPIERFYGMANADYEQNKTGIATASYQKMFSNGATWKTTVRHAEYDRSLRGTAPRLAQGTSVITDSTVINRSRQSRGATEKTLGLQSDFNHAFDTGSVRHELIAGVEVLNEKATRWNNVSSIANPATTVAGGDLYPTLPANFNDSFTQAFQGAYKGNTYSAYVQDVMQFAPKWKFMAGLRYDRMSADYTNAQNLSYNRTDKEFSSRFGLIYAPNDAGMVYASYSTGFNPSAELYQLDPRGTNTPPEKTRNIELGTKWNLLDNRLAVRASLSRSEKTNERNTDLAEPDIYLLSGKRHTDAFELEASGRLTDKWELYANYAHMRAKIDQGVGTSAANVGNTPANTPKNTFSVWTTYKVMPDLKLGLGVEGVSSRFTADTNTTKIDGYRRVDAMIEYNFNKNLTAKLNVFNLLNKRYYEGIYRGHVVPGTSRAAQLNLTMKF